MRITAKAAALLLALWSCNQDHAQSVVDAAADGANAMAKPTPAAVFVVAAKDTPGSYLVYANAAGGEGQMVSCLTANAADCGVGLAAAQPMRVFPAADGSRVFVSKPLALTADTPLHLVSADGAGKTLSVRSLRFVKTTGDKIGLDLPKERQVFQRSEQTKGKVIVRFRPDAIPTAKLGRARVTGVATSNGVVAPATWQEFQVVAGDGGAVQALIDAPAGGWFGLDVQLFDQTRATLVATASVKQVGIGEVFLVAGQSNSTNCGRVPQTLLDNDLVSSTNGDAWQKGDDPQLGTHDDHLCSPADGHGGSNWPDTGTILVRDLKVPVAFASTGYSGTSVSQWLPTETAPPALDNKNLTLFEYTAKRALQLDALGGYRAVLWHQGENDAHDKTTQDVYQQRLTDVIKGLRVRENIDRPWVIAVASFCSPGAYGDTAWAGASPSVTAAQQSVVANRALPELYAGPSTDDLDQSYRGLPNDSIVLDCHFNDAGLKEVGNRWAVKIEAFLAGKP